MTARRIVLVVAAAAVVAGLLALTIALSQGETSPPPRNHPNGPVEHRAEPYRPLTAPALAALPEARYDAVIAGLVPSALGSADAAYSIAADIPVYAADRKTAVARLAAKNFLGEPTVVVPVARDRDWARVLTPARRALPSANGGTAPAQTAGWIRIDALIDPVPLTRRIEVSIAAQTMSIVAGDTIEQRFRVGIGTPDAPTPQHVTGYLQARYLDAAQNQSTHPVQLTSLHSSASDEPLGGGDGGLIGVHYERTATGAVSHGCIRLPSEAIEAVNALSLGTLVTITS
ncbi:L,D-transpeptidase [Glaciihabitans sp. UYNi722]|uniref:L,D-transpeptidase n=1 Tax=Glaciihabitans sp. UYNi722 TaxID=3156344 RepID=UPI003394FFC1